MHSDLLCEAAGWILGLKPAASSPLHCAMAAPSVEDGNVYKLIKIIPWRWAYIEWVLFIIKICIDSYEIYLLECFTSPLR